MKPIKLNASQAEDQPVHEAFAPVELAGMDVRATVKFAHPERTDIRVEAMAIRNMSMDEYGVGYAFEIAQGKSWKKALLSRRNFGIDNFNLEMRTNQQIKFSGPQPSVYESSGMELHVRTWHWKGDEEIAKKALLDAVDFAIYNQIKLFNGLSAKTSQERLNPLPEPAADTETPAKRSKPKP